MDEFRTLAIVTLTSLAICSQAKEKSYDYKSNYIQSLINHKIVDQNPDKQIEAIVKPLAGSPYLVAKGMNNPIYRFDGFDCQTFVQTCMALLYSNTPIEFSINYVKIAYGALEKIYGKDPLFYNRNHFVEVDLNPVNRRNGYFKDVTKSTSLSPYVKEISASIDRQHWFKHLGYKVKLKPELFSISYIPKESLVLSTNDGYKPNRELLNKIPTPSVAEIINDPRMWNFHGKNIKSAIGTELTISHMGLLYKKEFKQGQIIYHRIICGLDWKLHKKCDVYAVRCNKSSCMELMLAHATSEYPGRFYWYKQNDQYVCSAKKPKVGKYSKCNRVEQIPLYAYLTNYHYGNYWIMSNRALLGIHIEKLKL